MALLDTAAHGRAEKGDAMGMIEQFEKVCNGLDTEIEHLKHKSDTATALNMSSVASSYEKQVVICRDALALIRQQQARIAELEAERGQRDYNAAVELQQYCERYEPTYNPEDGSM